MVQKGAVIFGAALASLIGSLFGGAIALGLVATAYLLSELWIGVLGVAILLVSAIVFWLLYGWFTEGVE